MAYSTKKELSVEQQKALLTTLKIRFEKNMERHRAMVWANIRAKLEANPEKLWSLNEMERTGGEPDVVGYDDNKNGRSHWCRTIDGRTIPGVAKAEGVRFKNIELGENSC